MRMSPTTVVRTFLSLALLLAAKSAQAETITLRTTPGLHCIAAPGNCNSYFSSAFTHADFAAADAGQPAHGAAVYPGWVQSLSCDPFAKWIDYPTSLTDRSVLYSIPFTIASPCVGFAQISICWSVDDYLGDRPGSGPIVNAAGAYINEVPLNDFVGGDWSIERSVPAVIITPYVHPGANTLYIYQRDWGCAIAGVMLSARIDVFECATPTTRSTWGRVKQIYR